MSVVPNRNFVDLGCGLRSGGVGGWAEEAWWVPTECLLNLPPAWVVCSHFILDSIGAFTRSQGPRAFLLQRLIAQSRATR